MIRTVIITLKVILTLILIRTILLVLVLLFLGFNYVFGQTDYIMSPEYLNEQQSCVKVIWVNSAKTNYDLNFDHYVDFKNERNNNVTLSTVNFQLFVDTKLIQQQTFKTGDDILNWIHTNEPIRVKKGQQVYIIFRLNPVPGERFIFNIFQKKQYFKIPQISKQKLDSIVYTHKVVNDSIKAQNALKWVSMTTEERKKEYDRQLEKRNEMMAKWNTMKSEELKKTRRLRVLRFIFTNALR